MDDTETKGTPMATLTKINAGTPKAYKVEIDGCLVGFIQKHANTRTETCPWQAFATNGRGQYGELLGSFYGRTGKNDALAALGAS